LNPAKGPPIFVVGILAPEDLPIFMADWTLFPNKNNATYGCRSGLYLSVKSLYYQCKKEGGKIE
jgi:hypothetical protein